MGDMMRNTVYAIDLLADQRQVIPVLTSWFVEEWAPWYDGGGGDAAADLKACCQRDRLPIALVAVTPDGQALGTAALKSDSVGSDRWPGPWLSAMLVCPEARGCGIGTALVAEIEDLARWLGLPEIYVSTDSAISMLERRAWQKCGVTETLRGEVVVLQRAL